MHFINSATQFTALNFIERMWVWNFWYFFFVGTFLCVYLCTANVCMLFVWKTLYVPFRAVCFFEKKIVLFPEIFFNLVNDINFLVIEFEGCMNGKLQVWCKCTAPYIWLWRAREWGSSSAVSQSFRPYHWFLPIISGPWDLRPPMISVVCDIVSPVVLSSPYHMTYLTNQISSCSTT